MGNKDDAAWLGKQWRGMPGGTAWEGEKSSTCLVVIIVTVGLPALFTVVQWLT